MEKKLSFGLVLSLEQIALRQLAVALYSEPRIHASIAKYDRVVALNKFLLEGIPFKREWRQIVEDKVSKLQLPKSLETQMTPIVKAVASEMLKWKSVHFEYFSNSNGDFDAHVFEKVCFTSAGVVDYRKTAEEIVRCDMLDIVKRFELACLYCLEYYIPVLWVELPDGKKSSYSDEIASQVETPDLQLFIPYVLEQQSKLVALPPDTLHHNFFEESALYGNKTLVEYCFGKLTKEEREISLVRTAKEVAKCRNFMFGCGSEFRQDQLSEVFFYLLCLMTPEDQLRIFNELYYEVVRCLLYWPRQEIFLKNADFIWEFLPESRYDNLLFIIYESIANPGYYLPHIFRNVFQRSPIEFRKSFVNGEIRHGYFLGNFLTNRDAESVRVIFGNVDAAERLRLVSSKLSLEFIYSSDWHLVKEFLRAAALSREDRERLKLDFVASLKRRGVRRYRTTERFRKFLEFVEETDGQSASCFSTNSPVSRRSPVCSRFFRIFHKSEQINGNINSKK